MKTLSEELQKNMMEVGQKVYTPDAGAEGGAAPSQDDAIETDFSTEK